MFRKRLQACFRKPTDFLSAATGGEETDGEQSHEGSARLGNQAQVVHQDEVLTGGGIFDVPVDSHSGESGCAFPGDRTIKVDGATSGRARVVQRTTNIGEGHRQGAEERILVTAGGDAIWGDSDAIVEDLPDGLIEWRCRTEADVEDVTRTVAKSKPKPVVWIRGCKAKTCHSAAIDQSIGDTEGGSGRYLRTSGVDKIDPSHRRSRVGQETSQCCIFVCSDASDNKTVIGSGLVDGPAILSGDLPRGSKTVKGGQECRRGGHRECQQSQQNA